MAATTTARRASEGTGEGLFRWLTHARREEASARARCPAPGCNDPWDQRSPFDVYCNGDESHLLPLGSDRRTQTLAVYAARAAFGALVFAAASWQSAVPLEIAVLLAGVLILALPLRLFPTARLAGLTGWLALIAAFAVVYEAGASPRTQTTLGLLAFSGLIGTTLLAIVLETDLGDTLAERAVGIGIAVAGAAALLVVGIELADRTRADGLQTVLLVLCVAGFLGAATAATLRCFLRAARIVPADHPFVPPERLRPPPIGHPARPTRKIGASRGLDRFAYAARRGAFVLALQIARLARLTVLVLWGAANAIRHGVARGSHAAKVAARIVAATVREAATTFVRAAIAAATAAWDWTARTFFGIALLAIGAASGVAASVVFASYLADGTIVDGFLSVVLTLVTLSALVVAWWPLTQQDRADVGAAAQRWLERAAPPVLLTAVALGWAGGLLGLLGLGPLRPGWLTISGTVILAAATAYAWRSNQPEQAQQAT